ncbi:hypothetical protein DACRYDRAFT_119937 [Dacryopinax primogenitus]|uniref:E3 ubiquitin-protein ligase listerin n=1 Tax=Dacryopinax primogenitus (strain DJM 731) TaxID=1858805 RepID=M5FU33_DACPD|nr:uncharacterized protein DACRYDRAFT_119937 [Dacryopinax primogenitus]EJT96726.1 hypothetical protein DACRYDRAFT_119937 [Dacryopinax primogenitus]
MAKGQKSSASSATRKKHAAKHGEPQLPPAPKQKGTKKSKEPKQKVYIPPPKYTPLQPDPLDTLGLVHSLPAELVVVLRRLGKKDVTTRSRALTELGEWVMRAGAEEQGGLQAAIPVWYHHFPALLIHPSRSLRLQTLQAQALLLSSPLRAQVLGYVVDAPEEEQERVLGCWGLAAFDPDRGVGQVGRGSWEEGISWASSSSSTGSGEGDDGLQTTEGKKTEQAELLLTPTSLAPQLLAFLSKTLYSPLSTYHQLHPPSAPAPPLPTRGAKHPLPQKEEPRREELELELEEERVGRLRTGALGALAWVLETYPRAQDQGLPAGAEELLLSPLFWTHLSPLRHPPWLSAQDGTNEEEGFGYSQIGVRRAAWGVLNVLLSKWAVLPSAVRPTASSSTPQEPPQLAKILSRAVLRSAWVEPEPGVRGAMWVPLLSFLTKFPEAWEVEDRSVEDGEEEDEEEEEDGDEAEEEERTTPTPPRTDPSAPLIPSPSPAYSEFLDFLRTACRGSPTSGYPTVLVILSTLPPSILPLSRPSLLELFRAFRAVSDDHILRANDLLGQRAFLAALLESMVYLSGKAWNATPLYPHASREGVQYLIAQEFERLTSLLLENPILLGDADIGRTIAPTLVRLSTVDAVLFSTAWVPLTTKLSQSSAPGVPKLLSTLHTAVHGTPCEPALREFVLQYAGSTLAAVNWEGTRPIAEGAAEAEARDSLLGMMQHFAPLLCSDPAFDQTLTAMLHEHLPALISARAFGPKEAAALLVHHLNHARTEEADDMWSAVLSEVGDAGVGEGYDTRVLQELYRSVSQGVLSRPLHPKSELRNLALDLLLHSKRNQGDVPLSSLLRYHERFLDEETTNVLLRSLGQLFNESLQQSLRSSEHEQRLPHLLSTLHSIPLSLRVKSVDLTEGIIPSLFLAAFVLPCCHPNSTTTAITRQVFDQWLGPAQGSKEKVVEEVRQAVRQCIEDVSVIARPSEIFDAYAQHMSLLNPTPQRGDLLPPRVFQKHLDELLHTHFDPVLSAVDFLIPATSVDRPTKAGHSDTRSYTVYARLTEALSQALTGGKSVALPSSAYWAVQHLLTISILAHDFVSEPGLVNVAFGPDANISDLQKLINLVDRVVPHTFSSSVGDLPSAWHQSTIAHLRKPHGQADHPEDHLATLVVEVYSNAIHGKSVLGARVLRHILEQIARRSTIIDLERWLAMAQNMEDKHPTVAMSIILAIKDPLAESPRLNRYHNELASRLSGVPPSRADSHGLPLLRLLIASAPSPDSLSPFIPQQRTIFLIQGLQKWMLSDEDLDEEIDRRLGDLLEVLAPVILDVPGAHWDLIFELLESNLEASTSGDLDLPMLYSSLKLVGTIRELAVASSVLREAWADHESQAMQVVRDIFLSKLDVDQRSQLQRACRDRVIELAQALPPSLVDDTTMQAMYARLSDASVEVQKTAYHLLHTAIPKITEQRVVEAAVGTSGVSEEEDSVPQPLFNLPPELITLLLEPLEVIDEDDVSASETFGRLLGWMVLFDFFVDASPALKSNYVEQLRSGELLGRSLFPSLIPLLPILKTGRPLKVELWNIEEFHVAFYSASSPFALSVLAAHLFYRALSTIPSLVRTWWMDIKDRHLSTALASFASSHFSPLLVNAEFAKLKLPAAEEELAHESLSLKVLTNVNEVSVTYTIDEQQMELGIRLPPDFPLHGVEVRDIKRVGVPVEKWRQWMLQVQQTITSQNGFLLDALVLFKKNVTLYFEGVTECAICYSVISTTDRSLPTKPCKTCRNLFHNSCLYKWFNTSNQTIIALMVVCISMLAYSHRRFRASLEGDRSCERAERTELEAREFTWRAHASNDTLTIGGVPRPPPAQRPQVLTSASSQQMELQWRPVGPNCVAARYVPRVPVEPPVRTTLWRFPGLSETERPPPTETIRQTAEGGDPPGYSQAGRDTLLSPGAGRWVERVDVPQRAISRQNNNQARYFLLLALRWLEWLKIVPLSNELGMTLNRTALSAAVAFSIIAFLALLIFVFLCWAGRCVPAEKPRVSRRTLEALTGGEVNVRRSGQRQENIELQAMEEGARQGVVRLPEPTREGDELPTYQAAAKDEVIQLPRPLPPALTSGSLPPLYEENRRTGPDDGASTGVEAGMT